MSRLETLIPYPSEVKVLEPRQPRAFPLEVYLAEDGGHEAVDHEHGQDCPATLSQHLLQSETSSFSRR